MPTNFVTFETNSCCEYLRISLLQTYQCLTNSLLIWWKVLYSVTFCAPQLDEAAMRESSADKDADQEEDKSSVTGDDDDTSYEELFGVVVTAKDGDRCVSDMFKVLPSRKVCYLSIYTGCSKKNNTETL